MYHNTYVAHSLLEAGADINATDEGKSRRNLLLSRGIPALIIMPFQLTHITSKTAGTCCT
jgi:hypothetical protein